MSRSDIVEMSDLCTVREAGMHVPYRVWLTGWSRTQILNIEVVR